MDHQQTGGVIILFGATGDLANRELFPALHQIYRRELLSENFAIIGAGTTQLSDKQFRDQVQRSVKDGYHFSDFEPEFLNHCFYQQMDNTKRGDYDQLLGKINEVKDAIAVDSNYVYYYSISPSLFGVTTSNLETAGVTGLAGNHRVLVEKPFGNDSKSATDYYQLLTDVFNEEVYFIDHFNAMEYVQNILTARYTNPVIEKMIHKDHVENIQISLPEHLSVGDRGAFYDENGALLDMFQNHLLQMLTMIAMELPETLDAESIHYKKFEVLESIPAFTGDKALENIVRGQYIEDPEGQFANYRDEPGVRKNSLTETYVALELSVNLPHLSGVPIYMRTGKALIENHYAVDVVFKGGNRLTFYIEPGAGMQFVLNQKNTEKDAASIETALGPDMESMDRTYTSEPYENVFYGGLSGDKTHFVTFDQIREEWRITDSIVSAWEKSSDSYLSNYTANTFGPGEADDLLEKNGHQWIKRPT
ncbi:glucose-6-phosphate dehydrogenase [Salinicoccus albus]|uniref:glucose-6-phosphate dehydrogenase n=1 Tax=Salinicoccus albus TaxID=418756 RepID=UPI00036D5E00|nr:glucose-6-phosphate dehydrogenase [Salinicoccus albus]